MSEKFADYTLKLLITILFVISFYCFYKIFKNLIFVETKFYFITLFINILGITFLYKCLNFKKDAKINLNLCIISCIVCLYSFEIFLDESLRLLINTKKSKIEIDYRNKIEVIDDLNKNLSDKIAYPSIYPSNFIESNGLTSQGINIFPLGGISNAKLVVCNENGYWSSYNSDKYGFNNSNEVYEQNSVDIFLSGNSYIEGQCVKEDETISANLRKKNYITANFGKGGNTPLIELGILREYGSEIKPKVVIMFLHTQIETNHLKKKESILLKYLYDKNFTQGLIQKQSQIDKILKEFVLVETTKIKNKIKLKKKINIQKFNIFENFSWHLFKIIKLTNLRSKLSLIPKYKSHKNNHEIKIYSKYLSESKKLIESWGGKMYLIYFPTCASIKYNNNYDLMDEKIKNIINQLNIPLIDLKQKVFDTHTDPMSLFPFRSCAHYNASGYNAVANAIVKRLDQDSVFK